MPDPSQHQLLKSVCLAVVCSVEFATSREEIEEEYKQRVREYKRSRSQVRVQTHILVLPCALILFVACRPCVHLGWLIPSEMVTGPTCNYSLSLITPVALPNR
jgi:hypothetical protein